MHKKLEIYYITRFELTEFTTKKNLQEREKNSKENILWTR